MNSFAFLEKAARQWPNTLAFVQDDERLTYGDFHRRALAIGGNLRKLGCNPGDRVAFCLPNGLRIPELVFGCLAAGLIVVPINARLHIREIDYILANSGAKIFVHDVELALPIDALQGKLGSVRFRLCTERVNSAMHFDELTGPDSALVSPVDCSPEDLCWLFYTSGTTGRPKGAMWNHRIVARIIMNYLADLHNIEPGEIVMHCAPMSHGSGIVALPAIARGATNIIMNSKSFDPDALFRAIEEFGVNHIAFMAPTQIIKMVDEHVDGKYDLSSLRAITYGGAPIYVDKLRKAIDIFGPVFVQLYGQGEAPITITGMNAAAHHRLIERNDARIGSAGQVRTDVEARCVDEAGRALPAGGIGEVVVRGEVVMPGYWNNPEATKEALRDGWLHTGDIGYFDEEGYLFLLDRAKDMIVSGGNNVYPREVEEIIILHPDVADCVVFGVPDSYWGEAVHAVVVAKPGKQLTASGIIGFCGDHLAGYKKPKAVDFVDALPVSGYGKVLRREIRESYWQGQPTRIGGGLASAPASS